MAASLRVRDQHIAVFGGSGSGKTVLVSSFYGAAHEKGFLEESLFHVIADDTGQGHRLRQVYLGMKNDARTPLANRFSAVPYAFTIKLKDQGDPKMARTRPFDALRLVWHDYPGEWFEQEPNSDEEAARRVDTFRSLLRSDVALVLVDGQMLLDHAGNEETYLKSLFWGLRDGLVRLKDDLLDDGVQLAAFPRVWIVALSKADLHPEMDAHSFQELIIHKAASDVAELRDVLTKMVQVPEALSFGEDFLLLSSAKFEPDRIEVTERIGLDLVLPVASLLPLERVVQWSERFEVPRRLLDDFADNADTIATILLSKNLRDLVGRIPKVGPVLQSTLPWLATAAKLSTSKVEEINATARRKQNNLAAVLTQFRLDLDRGVKRGILAKSLK